MTRLFCIVLMQCLSMHLFAQNTLLLRITDKSTATPLAKCTIQWGTSLWAMADSAGFIQIHGLPDGQQVFSFQHVGYAPKSLTFSFPRAIDTVQVRLDALDDELDEIIVLSTRTSRTIRNIPTRVEMMSGEELDEKGNMKPGDIRMMLNESTGIQTQQISATSANSSIRIQGLDGRYTQILKDGFPLYAGFSGGLGLLQTPPLDLGQLEIIKGSASTLYGGGAIAGLVNLVSKVPNTTRELRFLVNGTSARGLDVNGFYSERWKRIGLTLYAGQSSNGAFDPSITGFSAIPRFSRFVFNPKLFLYLSSATTLTVAVNTGLENRVGGDMRYLQGKGDSLHRYYERNKSDRGSLQISLNHKFNSINSLHFKLAVNRFKRSISIPGYVFDGSQWSGYSELAFNHKVKSTEWIAGLNTYTDDFREHPSDSFPRRNYSQRTIGGFIQNTWTVTRWLETETGMRADYTNDYGLALLPRISALIKYSGKLTSRVGGGFGYKTPNIFTEETERIQYRAVYPVSAATNSLERSYGANADFNYRINFGQLAISVNEMFFFTRIQKPLLLDTLPGSRYLLKNHSGFLDSRGLESNLKFTYRDFKLFLGYTFTDAHFKEAGVFRENPLTVRHRLNNVLLYEKKAKWKAGLEAYYFGSQWLNDGKKGKAYWTFGFMAEKTGKTVSIFVNFENFTDTRQTRFDNIYTGSVSAPTFRDIYAPLDGFVINGGVKIKLLK